VSRARSHSHDVGFILQSHTPQPVGYLFPSLGTQEKIRRAAIRLDAQIRSGREVALCNGTPVAIAIPFCTDQPGPRETMLRVGSPPSRDQEAERAASEIVVEVEQVSIPVPPELRSEAEKRAAGRKAEHQVHVGIMAEQRHVLPLREHGDPGCRMGAPDGS
jgi:hypothetical protein